MSLTKHQVNVLVGYMIAIYHRNGWPLPAGLAPYSGTVGKVKRRMIARIQTTYKLKVTGEFDTETQKFLTPVDPRAHKIAGTLAYQHWAVGQHPRFTYDQIRPAPYRDSLYLLPSGGRRRDCWSEATDGYHAGGFTHPDTYTFESGIGNTDSTLNWARLHSRIVPLAKARQCDAIIFSNPGHMVCITDPTPERIAGVRLAVSSDGHQGAPEYTTLETEFAYHHGAFYVIAID